MTATRSWTATPPSTGASPSTGAPPSTAAPPSILAWLEARVATQPWRTLGSAFLLGAWIGLDPPRAPRNQWARTTYAIIGSIALRVAREVALAELAAWARRAEHEPHTGSVAR